MVVIEDGYAYIKKTGKLKLIIETEVTSLNANRGMVKHCEEAYIFRNLYTQHFIVPGYGYVHILIDSGIGVNK